MIGEVQRPATLLPISRQKTRNDTQREHHDNVEHVRALARAGVLAQTYASADPEQRRQISGAVIAVASPVVFTRLTRVIELRRGHASCAVSMTRLADACLDRFYDDLEAVTYDVLHNATSSIDNLEGWLARRIRAATVDGHRRRRGARGALQRPRLPAWLDRGLGRDPWLGRLAVEILTWAGVPNTAGMSLWPIDGWSDLRAAFPGARPSDDPRAVEREVEQVLAVMRTRPDWFECYVERPMGAKEAPVAPAFPKGDGGDSQRPLMLVDSNDVLDAKLTELAALALAAIESQVARGVDLAPAIVDVLSRVFGTADLAREVGALPHGERTVDEQVSELVADPVELARIITAVQEILAERVGVG